MSYQDAFILRRELFGTARQNSLQLNLTARRRIAVRGGAS